MLGHYFIFYGKMALMPISYMVEVFAANMRAAEVFIGEVSGLEFEHAGFAMFVGHSSGDVQKASDMSVKFWTEISNCRC